VVIERILATVDGLPVMLSEVRLVQRLRGLERAAALDLVVDELLMFREARRLAQARLTPAEDQAAYESLLARPEAESLPEADLRRLARRQATITKYVAFRFRPQIRVSEDEIRQVYEAYTAQQPGAPDLADVREELRRQLTEHQLDERLETWVKDLRAVARIRHNRALPDTSG